MRSSATVAHGADESRPSVALQREDGQKVGLVERDVQLAVHHRAARLDVGDVEQVRVRAAGKADRSAARATWSARRRIRQGRRPRTSLRAVRHASVWREHRRDRPRSRTALSRFDLDAGLAQPIDQQPLVLVLRIDHDVRKWAETCSDVAESACARLLCRATQRLTRGQLPSTSHDLVREPICLYELERPRVDGERARRRSRLGGLVDDPNATPSRVSTRPTPTRSALRRR